MTFRVIIRDNATGAIYEIFPKSWGFTEPLNEYPEADFEVSFNEAEKIFNTYNTTVLNSLTSDLTELYFERDGVKIFYGVLSDMAISPDSQGDKKVNIKAIGWLGLFTKRVVGIPKTVYTATDAGAIAWDLIDDSQNSDSTYSDWGITQGSITTSKNRDRTYRFDNVYESIVRLSNNNLADGIDIEIDTSKQFNAYYPTKGQTRTGLIFSKENLKSYLWRIPLVLSLTNKVYVLGEGHNDDVLYVTRTAGTSYRSPFGTLEEVLNERDIITTDTLNDKGDRYLTDHQDTDITLQIEHFDDPTRIQFSDYNLGDTVYVDLPDLNINKQAFRVKERSYKMDADSVGLVKVLLE